MLINHHDQQIVRRRKTRNLKLCFGTNVGTNQAKIEKISISRAILFEFLRSLVSTIWFEANEINRLREERPIGSRAVKMFRDLLLRARSLAQLVAAANACAKVRARMHNWLIWCQGLLLTIGCVMTHSKVQPARWEPTEHNSNSWGGNLDSSVDSARFLTFTRMLRAEWTTPRAKSNSGRAACPCTNELY